MTHAFFKALLFLGAGSVIIALHHKQDMREMGGLARIMPITAITAWIGSLALIGFPFTSGFFSKDIIIESVKLSDRTGAGFATFAVYAGVVVTALYTFRMLYLTFHGSRVPTETLSHAQESPWVVTLPLILLAIPSLVIGWLTVEPLLFGGALSDAINVAAARPAGPYRRAFPRGHGVCAARLRDTPVFWLAMLGVAISTWIYLFQPSVAGAIKQRLHPLWTILDRKYGFDEFYQRVVAGGGLKLAGFFSERGDRTLIDGWIVHGSARLVGAFSVGCGPSRPVSCTTMRLP